MKMLGRNLPPDFSIDLAMQAMILIERFNVFEAGDTFHSKISGTAMSTPSLGPDAFTYATLYNSFHEIIKLMVK